jgi:integrase
MLNHAERWGYRPEGSNPCTFIRANKRRKCERFLSDQEVARLGKVLDARRKTDPLRAIIIYMLLLTGCRRSEITELTWGEVKGNRLLLHDSKTGPRTVWRGSPYAALDT